MGNLRRSFPGVTDIPGRAHAEKAGGMGPKSHAVAGVLWCLPSAKTTKGSLVSITGHNEPQGRQQLWPVTGVTTPSGLSSLTSQAKSSCHPASTPRGLPSPFATCILALPVWFRHWLFCSRGSLLFYFIFPDLTYATVSTGTWMQRTPGPPLWDLQASVIHSLEDSGEAQYSSGSGWVGVRASHSSFPCCQGLVAPFPKPSHAWLGSGGQLRLLPGPRPSSC